MRVITIAAFRVRLTRGGGNFIIIDELSSRQRDVGRVTCESSSKKLLPINYFGSVSFHDEA